MIPSHGVPVVNPALADVFHCIGLRSGSRELDWNGTTAAFNPYLTNGFSHRCQLGESTFIFRGILFFSFNFIISFLMLCANRIAPDGTPLGLYCLPMSHKRDARFIHV